MPGVWFGPLVHNKVCSCILFDCSIRGFYFKENLSYQTGVCLVMCSEMTRSLIIIIHGCNYFDNHFSQKLPIHVYAADV